MSFSPRFAAEEDPKKVLAATNVNGITANSQKPKNGNKSDSTPASKNGVQGAEIWYAFVSEIPPKHILVDRT